MRWLLNFFRKAGQSQGVRGERLAERWLKQRGFRILQRNLSIGKDEADLIALDPDQNTVVIVEVKTRGVDLKAPESFLTQRKQFHLNRLAASLQKQPRFADRPLRFDVVAIVWPEAGEPQVRHIAGAFQSKW